MTDEQPPSAPGGADGTWAPPGWIGRPDPTGPAPAPDSTTAYQRMPDWTVADPGGGPADDPGDRRRRRGRRLLATGVAGVIMIAAITTGVVLGAGGGKSASAAVIDAVDSTMADRTAQMSLAVAVSAGGTTVKEAGNGSIDFSQNAFQLTGSEHAGGQVVPLDLRYLDGIAYVSAPGISQELPGKSWLSLDVSSLSGGAGPYGASELSSNPAATLHILSQNGATVTELGTSTQGGVEVQGYAMTVSPAAVKADVAKIPMSAKTRAVLAKMTSGQLDAKVYVDGQGLLRSVTATMQHSIGSAGMSTLTFTERFSSYGSAIAEISAPPATQIATLQQVAQAGRADNGTSAASGTATTTSPA